MDVEISKAAGLVTEEDAEPPGLGLTHTSSATRATNDTPQREGPTSHRQLLQGDFWRLIPAYRDLTETTFLDHQWQNQNAVTRVDKLAATLRELLPEAFYRDVQAGMTRAPMSLRISPYIM